jgi:hypothetical protein
VRYRAEAGVLALLLSVGLVAAAPTAEARIVVGQSIAGVKLGMSMAQVKKKLGPPTLNQGADFKGDTEWNYAKKPLLGAMSFDKNGKLLGLWTSSKKQKTGKGVGPGASLAKVREAYPKAKCKVGPFGPKSAMCVIKSHYDQRKVETAFMFFTRSAPMREVDIDFTE